MTKCYGWSGYSGDSPPKLYGFLACATNPGWVVSQYGAPYYAPANNGSSLSPQSGLQIQGIVELKSQSEITSWSQGKIVQGPGCTNCLSTSVPHDCINGNCVPKTQYNTPGIYNSLASCQAVCGVASTDCPPGKVCLEQAEYNSINSLIAQLGEELCA